MYGTSRSKREAGKLAEELEVFFNEKGAFSRPTSSQKRSKSPRKAEDRFLKHINNIRTIKASRLYKELEGNPEEQGYESDETSDSSNDDIKVYSARKVVMDNVRNDLTIDSRKSVAPVEKDTLRISPSKLKPSRYSKERQDSIEIPNHPSTANLVLYQTPKNIDVVLVGQPVLNKDPIQEIREASRKVSEVGDSLIIRAAKLLEDKAKMEEIEKKRLRELERRFQIEEDSDLSFADKVIRKYQRSLEVKRKQEEEDTRQRDETPLPQVKIELTGSNGNERQLERIASSYIRNIFKEIASETPTTPNDPYNYPEISSLIIDQIIRETIESFTPTTETHKTMIDDKAPETEVKKSLPDKKSLSFVDLAKFNLIELAPTYAAHLSSLDRQRDSIMKKVKNLNQSSKSPFHTAADAQNRKKMRFVGASQAIPISVSYFSQNGDPQNADMELDMERYMLVQKIADMTSFVANNRHKPSILQYDEETMKFLLKEEERILGEKSNTEEDSKIQKKPIIDGSEFKPYTKSYKMRENTPSPVDGPQHDEGTEFQEMLKKLPNRRVRSPYAKPRLCETKDHMAMHEKTLESKNPFPLPSSYGERYMLIPEKPADRITQINPLDEIFKASDHVRPLSRQYFSTGHGPINHDDEIDCEDDQPFQVKRATIHDYPIHMHNVISQDPLDDATTPNTYESISPEPRANVSLQGVKLTASSRVHSPELRPVPWTLAPSRITTNGLEEQIKITHESESDLKNIVDFNLGTSPLPDIKKKDIINPVSSRLAELENLSKTSISKRTSRQSTARASEQPNENSGLDSINKNIDYLIRKHQSSSKVGRISRSSSPVNESNNAMQSLASIISSKNKANVFSEIKSEGVPSPHESKSPSPVSDFGDTNRSLEQKSIRSKYSIKRSNTIATTSIHPVILESLSTDEYTKTSDGESKKSLKTLFENKSFEMPPKDSNLSLSASIPTRKVSITSISIKKVIGLKKSESNVTAEPQVVVDEDEEMLKQIEAQLERSPTYSVELKLAKAKICAKKKRFENMIDDMGYLVSVDPHNIEGYWLRHLAYVDKKNLEFALRDLDKIISYNRQHLNAHIARAEILEATGKIKPAINALNTIIRLKPNEASFHYRRGLLLEADHESVMAAEDFKTATNLDPKNSAAAFKYGLYCFARQYWEDSIRYFERALDSEYCVEALCYRAKCNSQIMKWDDAYRDLNIAVRKDPNNPTVFLLRGSIEKIRNPRSAIRDLSVSLMLDSSDENIQAYIERATVYYAIGKPEMAIKDFLKVIAADESNYLPYLNVAIIYVTKLKNFNQAINYINDAIRNAPTNVKCYLVRARIYQDLFEKLNHNSISMSKKVEDNELGIPKIAQCLNQAIRDYSIAIYLDPQNFATYLHHGKLLLTKRLVPEARRNFEAVFKLKPELKSNITNRSMFNLFSQNYDEMFLDYSKYQGKILTPDYIMQARARMKQSRYEDAIEILNLALKTDKRNPAIFLIQGICFEYLQKYNEAIEKFNLCLDYDKSNEEAFYHRGRCKFFMGQEKGIHDITRAIKSSEYYIEPYLTRAAYFLSTDKDKWVLGISDCNEAIKIDSKCVRAYLLRGLLKAYLNQKSLALEDFTAAIKLDYNCVIAFYNRAAIHQSLGNLKEAMMDYSTCLLIDDQSPIVASIFRNRALIYWKNDQPDYALSDLYYAKEKFPNEANLHALLGLTLQKLTRYKESLECYSTALRLNPFLLEIYLGRGNVFIAMKNVHDAKVSYAMAIRMAPDFVSGYINLAYALQLQNRYKQAWSILCAAITIDPGRWESYEGRAIIHMLLKNNYAALYDIAKALELSPGNAAILNNQGVINQNCGNISSALKDFLEAIMVDPKMSIAHFNAGNLYFHQKQYEKALYHFNQAAESNVRDESSFLNRAICFAVLKRFDEALADFSKVLSLNPTNANAFFNRAQLYLQLGKSDLAEADLLKVLEISPKDSLAQLRLGDTLGKQSRLSEAMQMYASVEDHHLN